MRENLVEVAHVKPFPAARAFHGMIGFGSGDAIGINAEITPRGHSSSRSSTYPWLSTTLPSCEIGTQMQERPSASVRLIAARIVERFVRRADGELESLTAESTKPVAETRTHVGIVRVRKFAFDVS
jgi:hypothetical protein